MEAVIFFIALIPISVIAFSHFTKLKLWAKIIVSITVPIACFIDAILCELMLMPYMVYKGIVFDFLIWIFWIILGVISVLSAWIGMKNLLFRIISYALIAASLVSIILPISYNLYQKSIPEVSTGDREILDGYYPLHRNSSVALLDDDCTLKLTDDLPVMDGATALYPVYASFANAVYPLESMKEYYMDEGTLRCNTTTDAYENIISGKADIIFVAAPSEEQKKAAEAAGVELVYTPIGKEAFVFFVNSKNPIDDLTIDQVKDIYSGKITRWDELGVNGFGKIRPFQRDAGSGSQSALERLMGDTPIIEPEREDVMDAMIGIIHEVADYKNYKNAIGYSFRFYSTEMVKNGQIKLLKLNGAAPTRETIADGSYPISNSFYAVTRSDASDNTLRLLEWIQGEQGQELIEKTGYNPLK